MKAVEDRDRASQRDRDSDRHGYRDRGRDRHRYPDEDRDRDRGSATVLAIGLVLGLVTMLLSALLVVAVLVAGQQARAAADLASLAAAGVLVEGGDQGAACTRAGAVAADNGASLTVCVLAPGAGPWPDVRVRAERQVSGTPWTASAEAVAGGRAPVQGR